jgi:hypothetical protein
VAEKGTPALESMRLRVSEGQASRRLEKHTCADASRRGDNGDAVWHGTERLVRSIVVDCSGRYQAQHRR